MKNSFCNTKKGYYICTRILKTNVLIGEMAERSNAAVLKTVDCNRSGGSNPSFSAELGKPYKIKASHFL
jgi:hypothetical protein